MARILMLKIPKKKEETGALEETGKETKSIVPPHPPHPPFFNLLINVFSSPQFRYSYPFASVIV